MAARHQTMESSLHDGDQFVGRHRIKHILFEELKRLPCASFDLWVLPHRGAERLLLLIYFLFHLLILSDRIHLHQALLIFASDSSCIVCVGADAGRASPS